MEKETYTPEEVQKKFDSLPTDIKALVYSVDMLDVIQKIGTKYQLHIDQLGALEAETADVMTGFAKPEKFASNLALSLKIDQQKASLVAQDLNEQLFIKIRNSMKHLYGQGEVSSTPTSQTSLAQTLPTLPTQSPNPPSELLSASPRQPIPSSTVPKPPSPSALPPQLHPADMMLTQKTVTMPTPSANTSVSVSVPVPPPPKPTNYKTDPYREPPEL